jgi:FixJ family two-component response regulator
MNQHIPLVCVIDDESSIRECLSRLLRSAGLKVQTFASAQEFLTSRPAQASCLLLDVQMPGISGLELQRELGSGESRVPIIFMTGYGDIPMSVRAMKAGAFEFLTKPCRDEDLLRAVNQAIERAPLIEKSKNQTAEDTSFERRETNRPQPEILIESEIRRRELENLFAVLQKAGWKIKGADGATELFGAIGATVDSKGKIDNESQQSSSTLLVTALSRGKDFLPSEVKAAGDATSALLYITKADIES